MLGSVSFLVAAALLPPLILLAVVYRMDRLEKEPARLLWSLFFRGLLGMFPILLLEIVADQFIDFFPWDPMTYLFLAYFVVPGFIEEGVKNRVLRKRTWYDPNFNYRFDGIVYGMMIDLIFAVIADKIMYGANAGKLALIVTDHGEAVTERIDELCGRGTTIIDARGGFRKDHRDVVLCACSGKEMFTITREVKLLDPASFTIILESNEVHGEGFRMLRVAEPHAGDEK